jgi:1-acyl-sn-glycerol-3-phosphate acyltransferase
VSEGAAPAPADEAGELVLTKGFTYHCCRTLSRAWVGLGGCTVEGLENVPDEGGVMIVANHRSFLDIPLVAASLTRHVTFVARQSLADSWLLAQIMKRCGTVLVKRGASDRAPLRRMTAHLKAGDCLTVYPEGTRTRDGRLGEFKAGALLAARQARVPIVPAAILGTDDSWGRQHRLPRPAPTSIRYLAPISARDPDALAKAREAIAAIVEPDSAS